MTKYQLAKLILLAGGIKSRKRIQKTVHLLQATGCDFGLNFRLHHYGPYSSELAGLLDRMTGVGILTETEESTQVGTQYNYELTPEYEESLTQCERTERVAQAKAMIEAQKEVLTKLADIAPRTLELASTIAEFRRKSESWPDATKLAAKFKGEKSTSAALRKARKLAEELVAVPDEEN